MSENKDLLKSLHIDERDREKKSGRLAIPVLMVTNLALLGVVLFLFIRPGQEQTAPIIQEAATPPVKQTSNPEPVSIPKEPQVETDVPAAVLNASGYITARRVATVSAEITGLITDVAIEEGMMVAEGDILARLDDAIARADLGVAEARVVEQRAAREAIKANLAEARRELQRARTLRAEQFASEARFTQAEAAVAVLEADLERTAASIDVASQQVVRLKERLADHIIRAPFDGVVTVKAAQPGEIVSPVSAGGGFTRTGICTIVDMASLEIEVDVNEAYIGRISVGQRVQAELDAYPGWDVSARVIAVIPTANREKATVRVRVGLDEPDPRILPDMGVKVSFLE